MYFVFLYPEYSFRFVVHQSQIAIFPRCNNEWLALKPVHFASTVYLWVSDDSHNKLSTMTWGRRGHWRYSPYTTSSQNGSSSGCISWRWLINFIMPRPPQCRCALGRRLGGPQSRPGVDGNMWTVCICGTGSSVSFPLWSQGWRASECVTGLVWTALSSSPRRLLRARCC